MNKSKRAVLKGLATTPVWTAPIVESVVLPVHASTSGCYRCVDGGHVSYLFMPFEGNSQAGEIFLYEDGNICQGIGNSEINVVIANSEGEATTIYNNEFTDCSGTMEPLNILGYAGCNFWSCIA